MKPGEDKLMNGLEIQSKRRKSFEQRPSFWSQTIFTGTIGVIFILPVVLGAYLGRWIDTKVHGYCISWSINLILLGVIIGGINVYLFIKEKV